MRADFDTDKSGSLEYDELNRQLRHRPLTSKSERKEGRISGVEIAVANKMDLRRNALPAGDADGVFSLDAKLDSTSGVSYFDQLRKLLTANSMRVLDLFRDWDDDGNGMISKREFRRAMRALGLGGDAATRRDINELFNHFDTGGKGSLEYRDLFKKLRPPSPVRAAISIRLCPKALSKLENRRNIMTITLPDRLRRWALICLSSDNTNEINARNVPIVATISAVDPNQSV